MRVIFCMLLLAVLTACQANPGQPSHSTSQTPDAAIEDSETKDIVNSIMQQKIQQNGPKLLCSQSAYNACYKISQQQCLTEVGSFHASCLQKTVNKHGELQVGQNERAFGRYYSLCLMINHVVIHQDRSKEILSCIKQIEYNKQDGTKALLQ